MQQHDQGFSKRAGMGGGGEQVDPNKHKLVQ